MLQKYIFFSLYAKVKRGPSAVAIQMPCLSGITLPWATPVRTRLQSRMLDTSPSPDYWAGKEPQMSGKWGVNYCRIAENNHCDTEKKGLVSVVLKRMQKRANGVCCDTAFEDRWLGYLIKNFRRRAIICGMMR